MATLKVPEFSSEQDALSGVIVMPALAQTNDQRTNDAEAGKEGAKVTATNGNVAAAGK
jgi:hypothetical protein